MAVLDVDTEPSAASHLAGQPVEYRLVVRAVAALGFGEEGRDAVEIVFYVKTASSEESGDLLRGSASRAAHNTSNNGRNAGNPSPSPNTRSKNPW